MQENNVRFLIIGQTPPPYGGQSINIMRMLDALNKASLSYRFIRMNFSEEMDENGKTSFKKILRLVKLWFHILYQLIVYQPKYVYYPPSGPEKVPVIRDIVLLSLIRCFRKKLIFHFHAGGLPDLYPSLRPFLQKMFDLCYKNATVAICLNEAGKIDPVRLEISDVKVIPNGVEDMEAYRGAKSSDFFDVLFVGVCRETKGIIDFVKIIKTANKLNPKIRGVIVGKVFGDKEGKEIADGVKNGFIEYHGVKTGKEKNEIFGKSNALLFPTFFEHENFPTVILEAFSCGIPVVSTNWRGVVDQVQNGINGFRHDVGDIDSAISSIYKISYDEGLYRELSMNARISYEKFYTLDRFEKSIISFFKQLK